MNDKLSAINRRVSTTKFQHSGIKNIDAQTGTAQTVAATRQFDDFGNQTTSSGSWQGPFAYAGTFGYQEDATGLKLLGHRYYDSSIGRFITRDPIMDGRNWYAYCDNNPCSRVDANGLDYMVSIVSAGNTTNEGMTGGHSWIVVTDMDTGESWTIGNWNGDNAIVGAESLLGYTVSRTIIVKTIPAWLKGGLRGHRITGLTGYNAFTFNCSDFAIWLWQLLTGETLGDGTYGLDTPSSLVSDIEWRNGVSPPSVTDANLGRPGPRKGGGASSGSSSGSSSAHSGSSSGSSGRSSGSSWSWKRP